MLVSKYINGLVDRHYIIDTSKRTVSHRPTMIHRARIQSSIARKRYRSRMLRTRAPERTYWEHWETRGLHPAGYVDRHYIFRFCFLPLPILRVNLSRTSAHHCAYPFLRPGCPFLSSFTLRNYSSFIIPYVITFERLHKGLLHDQSTRSLGRNSYSHEWTCINYAALRQDPDALRSEDVRGKSIELQLSRESCIAQ